MTKGEGLRGALAARGARVTRLARGGDAATPRRRAQGAATKGQCLTPSKRCSFSVKLDSCLRQGTALFVLGLQSAQGTSP